LKAYFDDRGYDRTNIDWDDSQSRLIEQIRNVIDGLGEHDRHRVFDEFERVSQLTDEVGQVALWSTLAEAPEFLKVISEVDSHEGRALLALLRRPDAFEQALSVAYAERLQYGRSWSRFSVGKSPTPDHCHAARDTLSKEISGIFEAFDGSGRKVVIDIFERAGTGLLENPSDRLVQYTIYIEKLPESSLEFAEDGPSRRTVRPAREAALCLDPRAGILDVLSEGGKDLRQKIASAFVRIVLGDEAGPQPVPRRDFYLDRLKRPIGFPTDPRDRITNVAVRQLVLAASDCKFGRVTIDVGRSNDEDIYATCERWFGDAEPIGRLDWRVVEAKIRTVFEPEEAGRRKKIVTAVLRMPNTSNLKNQTWRHQLVSQKYLERWGLAALG
jgi:hypothetical protein